MVFRTHRPVILSVLVVSALPALGTVAPAAAEPATVSSPTAATATRYSGPAFDACTAPAIARLRAWQASPYRAVGIYIGGVNRACAQPELTARWVRSAARLGWRLVPIYVGPQAPCGGRPGNVKVNPASAVAQAIRSADDATASARALGILAGSAIYADMEHYVATDTGCRSAVLRYLSAWTRQLHRQGYLSGVYAHLNSGAKHLSQTYTSTSHTRPDALWIARWDRNPALTGWPGIPDTSWAVNQRAKQYRGDHHETWGGVTLNIDSNQFDAPVATVSYDDSR
jgi:Rv2525c-like, glycoside hydrolase-like domain